MSCKHGKWFDCDACAEEERIWDMAVGDKVHEIESLAAKLAAAEEKVKELESVEKQMTQALDLALEYWGHRQQRYKNRNPVWVEAAREARRAAIERSE